jgi:hypothetical protein
MFLPVLGGPALAGPEPEIARPAQMVASLFQSIFTANLTIKTLQQIRQIFSVGYPKGLKVSQYS